MSIQSEINIMVQDGLHMVADGFSILEASRTIRTVYQPNEGIYKLMVLELAKAVARGDEPEAV